MVETRHAPHTMKTDMFIFVQDELQNQAIYVKTVKATDILHNRQRFGLNSRLPCRGDLSAVIIFSIFWHRATHWVDAGILSAKDIRLFLPKIIAGIHRHNPKVFCWLYKALKRPLLSFTKAMRQPLDQGCDISSIEDNCNWCGIRSLLPPYFRGRVRSAKNSHWSVAPDLSSLTATCSKAQKPLQQGFSCHILALLAEQQTSLV
jgi:hypothetical protein